MGWTEIPGNMLTNLPVAASVGRDGGLYVFAVGTDQILYFNHFEAGNWIGWARFPQGARTTCPVSATRDHADRVLVVHTGLNGRMYHSSQTYDGWTPWEFIDGGTGTTALAVTVTSADRYYHWFHVGGSKRIYAQGLELMVAE